MTAVAGGLSLLVGSGALAGPIVDHATEAEQRAAAGDIEGAITAFDQASDALWAALPFGFRVAAFADSVTGYRNYAPRAEASFHAGDTATIYLEPVGYGLAFDGDDYRVMFSTGIEIRTPGGLILGRTDNYGNIEWRGANKSHEVQTVVSLPLPTVLKPGTYELILTLTDVTSNKAATTTLPFTIAE